MRKWKCTHHIVDQEDGTIVTNIMRVRADHDPMDPYDEPGWILYTKVEWDTYSTADWEQDSDGLIYHQGNPVEGLMLKRR